MIELVDNWLKWICVKIYRLGVYEWNLKVLRGMSVGLFEGYLRIGGGESEFNVNSCWG